MKWLHLLPAAVVALAVTGASLRAQVSPPSAPTAPLPSVTLPADLERVLRDYERGWEASDAAALAGLFADDGFALQPGRAPIRGRDAIRAAYARQAGGPLRLRALGYAAGDTVGWIVGAYGYGTTVPVADQGKFVLALRRQPGGPWLIAADMDNSVR